jgi:hypothetical protein
MEHEYEIGSNMENRKEQNDDKGRVTPGAVPGRAHRGKKLVVRTTAREGLSQLAERLLDEEHLQSVPEWVPEWVIWALEFLP